MLFAVDAIHDINKWFASIKRKIALKLLHFSLKQKYAKRLEIIWIISDVRDSSSYKSKTCLLHQNLGRHPSQSYWNVTLNGSCQGERGKPSAHFGQFWGEVTISPISLFLIKSLECRGCFGYQTCTVPWRHQFLSPRKIYIYYYLMAFCFCKWHVVFLPCGHCKEFCRVHLME